MPQSFNCPNCSAPLDVKDKDATTLRCPYCNTSVIVPEELRGKIHGAEAGASFQALHGSVAEAEIRDKLDFIKEIALAGNKMAAVKVMRDTFIVGLKQADEMVEAMMRGEPVDTSMLSLSSSASAPAPSLEPEKMQQIMDLIRAGDKIGAIKLFREATDVGLKKAKDTIDAMEAAMSATPEAPAVEISSVAYNEQRQQALSSTTKVAAGLTGCLLPGFVIFMLLVVVVPILVGLTSRGGPLSGAWSRINPFAAGNLTLQFGKEGTGPGYFTDARFVSVDNNGHIFVGEFTGGRVQVFDESGKYLTQWNATGEETGDIYLTGMAASREGAIYVVVGSQLYVYDGLNGNLLGRLDHPDGWGFDDVTYSPDGSIVAAWYKNRDDLIRFDKKGEVNLLVQNAISNVTNDSEMDMRVAVDGSGNIYTLGTFNEAVFVFTPDGRYISRFGSEGEAKGQFTSPIAIAIDNLGKVYIADYPGVLIYASDGRYLDTLTVNGAVMSMTFDDQNNLYLVAGEQVLRYKIK